MMSYFMKKRQPKNGILWVKSLWENEAERLVLDLFLFFKISLYEVGASGL